METTCRTITLIGGLPGSGKSTLAKRLAQQIKASHYEADMFYGANYDWSPEKHKEAHKWCQERVHKDMSLWHVDHIIVANTFTQKWEMEPYEAMARQYGYTVQYVTVETTLTDDELAKRNVHKVPTASITKMRKRWEPRV